MWECYQGFGLQMHQAVARDRKNQGMSMISLSLHKCGFYRFLFVQHVCANKSALFLFCAFSSFSVHGSGYKIEKCTKHKWMRMNEACYKTSSYTISCIQRSLKEKMRRKSNKQNWSKKVEKQHKFYSNWHDFHQFFPKWLLIFSLASLLFVSWTGFVRRIQSLDYCLGPEMFLWDVFFFTNNMTYNRKIIIYVEA